MRYVLGVIIGLVLAGLGIRVYQLQRAQNKVQGARNAALAVSVDVDVVKPGTIRDIGRFNGSLEAKYRFVVAPKIAGRLERVAVVAGDKVEPGRLIATIDAEELRLAVSEAEAALTVANATLAQSKSALEQAEREYERQKILEEGQGTTRQKVEETESDLAIKKATHSLNEAAIVKQQALLDAAKVRLGYATITADWDRKIGSAVRYVGERFADEGAMLGANDPICSVLDIETLTAVLDVPEPMFPRLSAGMPVNLSVSAYPGEEFTGTLRIRPAELSSSSRQARVEVDVPNPRSEGPDGGFRLVPGMFTEARVVFGELPDVPLVPVSAVVRRDERQGVYVVERYTGEPTGEVAVKGTAPDPDAPPPPQYQARFVPVKTGISEGNRVEIRSPAVLAPVVVLGQNRLLDRTAVELNDKGRRLVEECPPQPPNEDA